MEKYYPNTYYMKIYEDFKRLDGSESYYSKLMFNPSTSRVAEDYEVRTKSDLKEKVEEQLSHVANLQSFNVTETKYGWKYERFMKTSDDMDSDIYEIVEEGQHTDHELFTVEISYYEDVNAMERLERWERFV